MLRRVRCHQRSEILLARATHLVALAIASSCAADDVSLPPIRYETSKATIGTSFEEPLCEGDLQHIDARIRYLEEVFDAHSDDLVEIYLYREKPPECPIFGCFVHGRYIASEWTALDHELVHAVVSRIGRPEPFWSEGNAVAFSGGRSQAGTADITEQIPLDARSLDYVSAGHFMRWLVEQKGGPSQIQKLLVPEPFSNVYGMSEADAEAEFLQTAPWSYPPLFPCSAPELGGAVGQWEEEVAVDCESADTLSRTGYCATVVRSLRVEDPGMYELVSAGGNVRLVGCQLDALPEDPGAPAGDIPFEYEDTVPIFKAFEPGITHELRMDVGLYEITVESCDLEEPSAVMVRLTRVVG